MSKSEMNLRVFVAIEAFVALSLVGIMSGLWYVLFPAVLAGAYVAFTLVEPVDAALREREEI